MGSICDGFAKVATAGSIANNTTDFFTAIAVPGPGKVVTISVSLDTSVKLYARIDGVNSVMNGDTALTANALYTFSFIMNPALTLTFRASAACAVNYFYAAVSME